MVNPSQSYAECVGVKGLGVRMSGEGFGDYKGWGFRVWVWGFECRVKGLGIHMSGEGLGDSHVG